jgi:hypothetical protein
MNLVWEIGEMQYFEVAICHTILLARIKDNVPREYIPGRIEIHNTIIACLAVLGNVIAIKDTMCSFQL